MLNTSKLSASPHFVDLTDKEYGWWLVLRRSNGSDDDSRKWRCLCRACNKEYDVSSFSLRHDESTGCAECRRAGRLNPPTQLVREADAHKILGLPGKWAVERLRERGVLLPVRSQIATGRYCPHYEPKHLEDVKPCIKSYLALIRNGIVQPSVQLTDGQANTQTLWVIQFLPDHSAPGEFSSQIVDLGAAKGAIFSMEKGAKKYKLPLSTLRLAVANGEKADETDSSGEALRIPSILVYGLRGVGGHRQPVCFAADLAELAQAYKADRVTLDRDIWVTTHELCALVGAKRGEEFEAIEQAKLWGELGLVQKQTIRVNRISRVATKFRRTEDGKRKAIEHAPVERKHRQELFNRIDFMREWEKPLDEVVKRIKELCGKDGIAASALRQELKQIGVGRTRFYKVIRMAGATTKPRSPGEPGVYFIKYHNRPTPIRKQLRKGKGKRFVLDQLKDGPQLASAIHDAANKHKPRIDPAVICRALKQLGCKCFYVKMLGPHRDSGFAQKFWRLPQHAELSKDDARRVIAEYRQSKARGLEAGAKQATQEQGRPAAIAPKPPVGELNASENGNKMPARRGPKVKTEEKLRICHSLYARTKTDPDFSLKNALSEARKQIKLKPPKKTSHIIEYAKRYEKTEEFKRSHNSKPLFT